MDWLRRALTLPKNRNSLADLSPEFAGKLTSDLAQLGHFWVGIGKRAAALAQAGNLDGLEQFGADLIAAGQEAVSQPVDLSDPLKAERIAGRAFAAKWDIAL